MSSFALLLKEARERTGLTQKDLAAQVGINNSYISRIERGTCPAPTREKVVAMAEALGITEPVERVKFLFAASCGTFDDLVTEMEVSNVVAVDNLLTQEDPLIEQLRDLLARALLQDRLKDVTRLVLSFFDYLAFTLDEKEREETPRQMS
jgi:transcriptional regulator with XRE-family HTH domain